MAQITTHPRIVEIITNAFDAGREFPEIILHTANGARVKMYRAGSKSAYEGCVQVTDGGPFDNNVWYGRVERDGRFITSRRCTPAVRDLVARFDADPASVAAAYGLETGECCFCARELTDARSTGVGYGPVCAKNYGLPWGDAETLAAAKDGDGYEEMAAEADAAPTPPGQDGYEDSFGAPAVDAEDALAAFEAPVKVEVIVHPPRPAFDPTPAEQLVDLVLDAGSRDAAIREIEKLLKFLR